jgi:hypothetical protein
MFEPALASLALESLYWLALALRSQTPFSLMQVGGGNSEGADAVGCIYLSRPRVSLSIYLLSIYLSIYLNIYLFYLSIYLLSISVRASSHVYIYLLSIYLSIYYLSKTCELARTRR